MRIVAITLILIVLPTLAHAADPAQAREVARINNCPPKKIEVYSHALGEGSETVYRVDCNMPKATGPDTASMPDSLLVSCDASLCTLLRPLKAEKK